MLALTLLAPAAAADLDDSILRGSYSDWFSTKSYKHWDGWNFGVQLGASNMNTDFAKASGAMVGRILRNSTVNDQAQLSSWEVLPSTTTNGTSYGVFLGYNMQWDQLVVGFDGAYNRLSTFETSAGPVSLERIVTTQPDKTAHDITITSNASVKLIDYATMRLRAGYAFGQFLPYAIVGAAAGRFNYTNSVTLKDVQTTSSGSSTYGPITDGDNRNGAITAGFLFGLGMDVAVLPNVFVRGEWETVSFTPISGIRVNLNTGRVALGLKF